VARTAEEQMRRFFPKSKMGVFALVVCIFWVINALLFTPQVRHEFPILGVCFDLVSLLIIIPAAYYIWKLFGIIKGRFLWKIRRRLILAHMFIGAIPVFMVIVIFYFSALLFYYQFNNYLIENQIGLHSAQIHAFNLSLREGIQSLMTGVTPPSPAAMKDILDSDAKYLLGSYPSAVIILRFPDPATNRLITYANQNLSSGGMNDYQIPHWIGDREFSGLVAEDMQPQIYGRKLFLRSFVNSDFRPDLPFSIEVSVPFDHYLLGRLKAALGLDFLLADNVKTPGLNVMLQSIQVEHENIIDSTFETEKAGILTGPLWSVYLFPVSWTAGTETEAGQFGVLRVELSTTKLWEDVFRSENTSGNSIGSIISRVLKTTLVFFLIVEIVSVVIGILLTKSITNAIHNLDRGTEFVKRGDFSQRIIVRSADQLGALAASFNQMTEYVQHLVKESVQKERLERELEIAKEVQEQLFPTRVPEIGCMDIAGICLPARIVSGDYYDFLPLGTHELGMALGDICGKGISAALLMANLQAALRSNVLNLWRQNGKDGEKNVAEVVQRLNSQIFSYTSANKFASFFYAIYDESQKTLTYCNAGHNPPLFFSDTAVHQLRAGGTVVGVFADSLYEQETIKLNAGNILLAYTDGITECVNEYGEEFGEERLIQLIQSNRDLGANELKGLVVDKVLSWTFSEERDDDMTLIVAKILDSNSVRKNS
jgi:phosphoserine phosphatase RsbU/P